MVVCYFRVTYPSEYTKRFIFSASYRSYNAFLPTIIGLSQCERYNCDRYSFVSNVLKLFDLPEFLSSFLVQSSCFNSSYLSSVVLFLSLLLSVFLTLIFFIHYFINGQKTWPDDLAR
jgi:hypothetical protein